MDKAESVNQTGPQDIIAAKIVLIVEDEFLLRHTIATYFRDAGCVVVEAESAEQAMTMCHGGTPVDILITDIQLGGPGSGWDVAAAFRSLWKMMPVIYTSGRVRDRTRSVPNSLFIDKPYRLSDIMNACQRLLVSAGSS